VFDYVNKISCNITAVKYNKTSPIQLFDYQTIRLLLAPHVPQGIKGKEEKDHQLLCTSATDNTSIGTRCSAIAERPRCRVRYSFRQK